jgi:hypothetical protein
MKDGEKIKARGIPFTIASLLAFSCLMWSSFWQYRNTREVVVDQGMMLEQGVLSLSSQVRANEESSKVVGKEVNSLQQKIDQLPPTRCSIQ